MTLFIPGPVEVEEDILLEMSRPMIGHRSAAFKDLHTGVMSGMRELLRTDREVLIMPCSATGAMEAVLRSVVSSRVLCLANGAFGRRWHEIALANGKEADLLDFGEGVPYDDEAIGRMLSSKKYDAVTVVLNDTATGILNDLSGLQQRLCAYPETLLLADGVTAAFGAVIAVEEVDVLVFGSQKALALPPGLGFIVASEKAFSKAALVKDRGFSTDILLLQKHAREGFTLTTPNISAMYALRARLESIREKGVEAFIAGHDERMRLVREFFVDHGFRLFVDEEHASPTVTVVENTVGIDVAAMLSAMKASGFVLADGYGTLKGKAFRIGHMGVTAQQTKEMLARMEEVLGKSG